MVKYLKIYYYNNFIHNLKCLKDKEQNSRESRFAHSLLLFESEGCAPTV